MAKNIDKHEERITLTIYEQFIEALKEKIGDTVTFAEIKDRLITKFNTKPGVLILLIIVITVITKGECLIKICLYI